MAPPKLQGDPKFYCGRCGEYLMEPHMTGLCRLCDAQAEIARLRAEGTPGVMHSADRAFYDLAIKERNLAHAKIARLEARIAVLEVALETCSHDCDDLIHENHELHKDGEPCPVEARIERALREGG